MPVFNNQADLMAQTRDRMRDVFTPNQILGRLQTIGCVAVEITQRCNLDCTLCYLSENSQAVVDIPIEEVYRRLDDVITHFGKGTHVQITGGDPTLRKHVELVKIVEYASNLGLYPALFTNGIAASRDLLKRLADVGLCDVAFHVDTTQRRKGFASEEELNSIRTEYIERARGLGLMVILNTTVHKGNFYEIPSLVKFMGEHADIIGLASFQLQAETGRGEWGSRDFIINQKTVQQQIEQGIDQQLPWDVIQVGHGDCHNYLPTLSTNGKIFPIADDKQFFAEFLRDFSNINWDRHDSSLLIALNFLKSAIQKPARWPALTRAAFRILKRMGPDLIRAKGKVNKLTFFVQNFMDANHLDDERIGACSFMVMTADGPVSMCEHNARRDDFILKPLEVESQTGQVIQYAPLKGKNRKSNKGKSNKDNTKQKPAADFIPVLTIND